MKKFNWKNRGVIGSLLTVLLLGFGIDQAGLTPVVTEIVCEQVGCQDGA